MQVLAAIVFTALVTTVEVRFRILAPPNMQSDWPSDARLFVSGDLAALGGWRPDGLPLSREGEAWLASVRLPEGPFEWKVTLGSWDRCEVQADGADRPNRRSVARADVIIEAVVEGWRSGDARHRVSSATGDIRRLDPAPSRSPDIRPRSVLVRLPADYGRPECADRRYAVVYMLDGQNVFDAATSFAGVEWRADETVDRLAEAAEIEPCIVVAIPNSQRRIAELSFPLGATSEADASGPDFLAWIVDEAKPLVDRTFRTKPQADATVIVGSSLGGLFVLEALARRPDVFSRGIAMSPSLWRGDEALLRAWTADPERRPRPTALWIGMGTDEGRGDAAAHVERALRLAQLFADSPAVRLAIDSGAKHHESDWARRLPDALRFTLGPSPSP